MMRDIDRLSEQQKDKLRLLFIAKHALSSGQPDPVDGTHSTYHHELFSTLRCIGLNVVAADKFEAILDRPHVDFVFPLLNRAGFTNSEMLAPLLLTKHDVPYLGAAPIIRGLADDKHLMKIVAQSVGVPVAPWSVIRRGQKLLPPTFARERLVVKPNASSASWGVGLYEDWGAARDHANALLGSGHDVIVESFLPGIDVAVPVVGREAAWIMPMLCFQPAGTGVRSYEEKRNLRGSGEDVLEVMSDPGVVRRLEDFTRAILPELWPFDYGRFEFRLDPQTGELRFLEVNLSCNLWSKKTMSRSGRIAGLSHLELVETIVTHSMRRQGVLDRL